MHIVVGLVIAILFIYFSRKSIFVLNKLSGALAYLLGFYKIIMSEQVLNEGELIDKTRSVSINDNCEGTPTGKECRLRWTPTSLALLKSAEEKILSYLKTPFTGRFVPLGPVVGKKDCNMWTLSMNETAQDKTPLVLVHGFASGVALWALNLDELAQSRPVYAFDVLGFGRSSRPHFSSKPEEAEAEMIGAIEAWRKELGLERFVLLGHSMGGYFSASYAIKHPERVSHLVLADPWGFPEKPKDNEQMRNRPLWVKMLVALLQPFNPLSGLRAAGPYGPGLVKRARQDILKKFSSLSQEEDGTVEDKIAAYIFHCNAQKPSGETMFHSLIDTFAWSKFPMMRRIPELKPEVPITFIYGSDSWVDRSPGGMVKEMRPNSYVNVNVIKGAGHHVYGDIPDMFNGLVKQAASQADQNDLKRFQEKKEEAKNV